MLCQVRADLLYENALTRWLVGGRDARARRFLVVVIGLALAGILLVLLPIQFALLSIGLYVVAVVGWTLVISARS